MLHTPLTDHKCGAPVWFSSAVHGEITRIPRVLRRSLREAQLDETLYKEMRVHQDHDKQNEGGNLRRDPARFNRLVEGAKFNNFPYQVSGTV